MTKFAVIESGGKQYKVATGSKIKVERLGAEVGAGFSFDKVLLRADSSPSRESKGQAAWSVEIGTPYIQSAKVEGKVVRAGREKKKIVFKYHPKTRYKKKKGHRQHYTEMEIVKF